MPKELNGRLNHVPAHTMLSKPDSLQLGFFLFLRVEWCFDVKNTSSGKKKNNPDDLYIDTIQNFTFHHFWHDWRLSAFSTQL